MRATHLIMGMPVTVEVADHTVTMEDLDRAFSFFRRVDAQYSPFKPTSETSRFRDGRLRERALSPEFREILGLAEATRRETDGYFDVFQRGKFDPSGIVKGWAIQEASALLAEHGFTNTYVEAGGDIQVRGRTSDGKPWRIGIRHPLKPSALLGIVTLSDGGIATSGTYERGLHILNPKTGEDAGSDIVSTTVIAPTVFDADRYATAAFAMGLSGIAFLERHPDLEGCQVDRAGHVVATTGFLRYIARV